MEKKSLTLNGLTISSTVYALIAILMVGTSIYLTTHYYDTIFPTTLGGAKSLCDISSFFNCDVATYSPLAAIVGVPISFFGIVVGLVLLASALFPSEGNERTASVVAKINLIGCIALFVYSLVVLGSLCPFCTFYYVLSAIAAIMLWRNGGTSWSPDMKVTAIWAVIPPSDRWQES